MINNLKTRSEHLAEIHCEMVDSVKILQYLVWATDLQALTEEAPNPGAMYGLSEIIKSVEAKVQGLADRLEEDCDVKNGRNALGNE